MYEDIKPKFNLRLPTQEVVVNNRGLVKQTKKSQLPYIIQGLLLMIVPSKNELSRLNKEFIASGEKFLVFDVPLSKSNYTNNSELVLLTSSGYADVTLLRTLFHILRLFYKEIRLAKKELREPSRTVQLNASMILKEFNLKDAGANYKSVIKHLQHLSSTGFHVKLEQFVNETSGGGVKDFYQQKNSYASIQESIESIISIDLAANSLQRARTAQEVFKSPKSVFLQIKLSDLLFDQLVHNKYRLIDLVTFNDLLKSDIAKVLYTYLVFHNQSEFSIGVKKLCSKTAIKYSDEPVRKKALRRNLREALKEIEIVTDGTIRGIMDGEKVYFSFASRSQNLPIPKNDFGSCPKCGVGRVIATKSKTNDNYYWFCNRGKENCSYVSDNEPKRI